MTEAESLKSLTCEERLGRCVFKYERTEASKKDVMKEGEQTKDTDDASLQIKPGYIFIFELSYIFLHFPTNRSLKSSVICIYDLS